MRRFDAPAVRRGPRQGSGPTPRHAAADGGIGRAHQTTQQTDGPGPVFGSGRIGEGRS
jgi:hypothetical protein